MINIKDQIAHLDKCYKDLDALKIQNYIAPQTSDDDTNGDIGSISQEYDFNDAYLDPIKAIGLMIEICQSLNEITGGKRTVIITEAQSIKIRKKLSLKDSYNIDVSSLYLVKKDIILSKEKDINPQV